MPKTTKSGEAKQSELPSTLKKSDDKAQRTFAKAHDAAAEEYGEGERAYRTAYSALKHSYEKVGDRWEEKEDRGPSDERARSGGPNASGETAEGVNANATKKHLMDVAKRLADADLSLSPRRSHFPPFPPPHSRPQPFRSLGASKTQGRPSPHARAAGHGQRHLVRHRRRRQHRPRRHRLGDLRESE